MGAIGSGDHGKAGQGDHAGKNGGGDDAQPDVAVLAIDIGYHTGSAAHHVAVAEGKVQRAAAGVLAGAININLGDQGLAGADDQTAAVLDEQQNEQGGSGHNSVDSHGDPQILALIAGGGEHPLAHIADEHDHEDDDHILSLFS